MLYIITMFLSLFDLIMTIAMEFADEESAVFMFFDEQKAIGCVVICAVLLVIGMVCDGYKARRCGDI